MGSAESLLPADPELRTLSAEELPRPYRELLAHRRDMTSTLEAFHGQGIGLRVLEARRQEETLLRRVVLHGQEDGQPVEFGAIRIHLATFPGPARAAILAGQRPLGGILADFQVGYRSRPRGFFEILPGEAMARELGLVLPVMLFGRHNLLVDLEGEALAEVVEILPPLADC